MSAFTSEIISRQKRYSAALSTSTDFDFGPKQAVSAEIIFDEPGWSLYCLDLEQDFALFVKLPPDVDLAEAPFVYAEQFDKAERALLMTLDHLPALAQRVPLRATLSTLFSTGRCGSTLASRILAQIPNVWSISEPDFMTNLAFARFSLPSERVVELIGPAIRLTCRPPEGRALDTIVIKPRSESIFQAKEYALALPEAHNLFMYRDTVSYVNSLYRFLQRVVGPDVFFNDPDLCRTVWPFISGNAPESLMDEYFPESNPGLFSIDAMTLGWCLRIDAYFDALEKGAKLKPLHYADLNTDRRAETEALLSVCGISLDHVDLAMRGFERDAHCGSAGENAVPAIPLDDAQMEHIRSLLNIWNRDDYSTGRLPATLAV